MAVALLGNLDHGVEESHPAAIEDPAFFDSFGRQMCAATAWVLDHYWPRRTGVPVTAEDVEPMTWRMATAAGLGALRIEPSGASTVIGASEPALFGIEGAMIHFTPNEA